MTVILNSFSFLFCFLLSFCSLLVLPKIYKYLFFYRIHYFLSFPASTYMPLPPSIPPSFTWLQVFSLSCFSFVFHPLHSKLQSHHLWLRAHSHLTEVDGEDGVRAGALSIHLGAGCGPGQSTELQTLQQLQGTPDVEDILLWSEKEVDNNDCWHTMLFCWITTITCWFRSSTSLSACFSSLHPQNAVKRNIFLLFFCALYWLVLSSFSLSTWLLFSRSITSTLLSPPSPCFDSRRPPYRRAHLSLLLSEVWGISCTNDPPAPSSLSSASSLLPQSAHLFVSAPSPIRKGNLL